MALVSTGRSPTAAARGKATHLHAAGSLMAGTDEGMTGAH